MNELYDLTIEDIKPVLQLIRTKFGLVFSECSRRDIVNAIINGIKQSNCSTVDRFADQLQKDDNALIQFISQITITETYFFREEKQFQYIRILLESSSTRRHWNCWSVTCASGEEAYSLSLLLDNSSIDSYTVYASDINIHALSKAEQGSYTKNSLREDGSGFHSLLERCRTPDKQPLIQIPDTIKGNTRFFHFNLNRFDSYNLPDNLDLVLFRNTLIYIPYTERNRIIQMISRKIRPGGYLFLGSSEIPWVDNEQFETVEMETGGFCLKRIKKGDSGQGGRYGDQP